MFLKGNILVLTSNKLLSIFQLRSGPPEIESVYLDRYVAQEGDTVKLNCPIIGTPKPIIEWYQVRLNHYSMGWWISAKCEEKM